MTGYMPKCMTGMRTTTTTSMITAMSMITRIRTITGMNMVMLRL